MFYFKCNTDAKDPNGISQDLESSRRGNIQVSPALAEKAEAVKHQPPALWDASSPGCCLVGALLPVDTHTHNPPSSPMPFAGTGCHRMHCVSVQTSGISRTWETVRGRKTPSANPERCGPPGKHWVYKTQFGEEQGGMRQPAQLMKTCNEKDLLGLCWLRSCLSQAGWGQAVVLLTLYFSGCHASLHSRVSHGTAVTSTCLPAFWKYSASIS